jgi:hypothetical protein
MRRVAVLTVMTLALTIVAARTASAQNPVMQQGPSFGTFSVGEVAIPLRATGGAIPGTYTWQVTAGALPPGVSLRTDTAAFPSWFPADTKAALLGVATTPSTTAYSFTLRVTSGGTSTTQNATLRVTSLMVAEPWTLPRAYVNKPFSYQLKTVGQSGAVTWTGASGAATTLSSFGLSLTSGGVIQGTPTRSGNFSITVQPSDGFATFRSVTIDIHQIEITSPASLPNAQQGEAYEYELTATGGQQPYTWSTTWTLPSGLVLDSDGTISGVSTAGRGPWQFEVTVTDNLGRSTFKRVQIDTIREPQGAPRLTPYSSLWEDCTLGWPCERGVSVSSGGTAPFTYEISGQPLGMYVSPVDGWWGHDLMITGAPAQTGDFDITVTATDANGLSTTNVFPLHVSPLLQRGDSFKPLDLINGDLGVPYSRQLSITGGVLP